MTNNTEKKTNPIALIAAVFAVLIVGIAIYTRLAPSQEAQEFQESTDKLQEAIDDIN